MGNPSAEQKIASILFVSRETQQIVVDLAEKIVEQSKRIDRLEEALHKYDEAFNRMHAND